MSTAARVVLSNPFPGLRPFRDGEEHLFFGRENQVDAIVDKLAATRFLAVLGSSGSGKSSLVNCGLRPALHRGLMTSAGTAWRIAQFRPGADPIRAMAQALAQKGVLFSSVRSSGLSTTDMIDATLRLSNLGLVDLYDQAHLAEGTNLILIVDQFEELFRYRNVCDASERLETAAAFVNLLLEARRQESTPIYIVLTMRSDFLGDCAEFPGLPEAMNEGQYLVPRMTREELKSAIQGPIGVCGGAASSVLLTRLVNDVGESQDQLSVLQHALNRTWVMWQKVGDPSGPLELSDYEKAGTMAHALDRHAERAFNELKTAREQAICKRLFKTLTDKGTDARGVRRPVSFAALCRITQAEDEELRKVIEVFRKPSRSFLMPPRPETLEPDTIVDISHESLMRVWQRLNRWADKEAQSAQLFDRLAKTAALYAAGQAGLWRDPDLTLALEWQQRQQPTEAWADLYGGNFALAMEFLSQSKADHDAEVGRLEEQRQRELQAARALAEEQSQRAREQARAAHRSRLWAVVSSALALAAILGLFYALNEKRVAQQAVMKARHEAEKAEKAEGRARRNEVNAEREEKAAQAATKEALAASQAATLEKANAEREARRNFSHELAGAAGNEVGRDDGLANLLALESVASTYRAGGPIEREAVESLQRTLLASNVSQFSSGHLLPVNSVAYSASGFRIATASDDGTARIWDAQTGLCLLTLAGHAGAVNGVVFSPNGKLLATAGRDRTARLWDAESGDEIRTLRGHLDQVRAVVFSPDGKWLATASQDTTIRIWNVNDGKLLHTLIGHTNGVNGVAFNPQNANRLGSASADGTVKLWDVEAGQEVPIRSIHPGGTIDGIAFSPDGTLLASAGSNRVVDLWEAATGDLKRTLPITGGEVHGIAFSPDGKRVVAVSTDRAVHLWDIAAANEVFHSPSGLQMAVAFRPDGKRFVTGGFDAAASVWDSSFGYKVTQLQDLTSGQSTLALSAGGMLLADRRSSGQIRVNDARSGLQLFAVDSGNQPKNLISLDAFSANVRYFAVARDRALEVWDVAQGRSVHKFPIDIFPSSLAVSDDGARVLDISNATFQAWNTVTGSALTGGPEQKGIFTTVAFSPARSGRLAAVGKTDGSVVLVDASGDDALSVLREVKTGHLAGVNGIVFSADGKRFATTSLRDEKVRIWDSATGQLAGVVHDTAGVTAAAFSPDAAIIATLGVDRSLKLWSLRAKTGEEILDLPAENPASRLAFSTDGRHITIASPDAKVHSYPLNTEDLLEAARQRLERPWSAKECRDYLHSETCPASSEAIRHLVDANNYARQGNRGLAMESYRMAQALDPAIRMNVTLEIRALEAQARLAAAERFAWAADEKNAMENFRKARELNPAFNFDTAANARHYAAVAYAAKGRNLALANEMDEAVKNLQKAKELDPNVSDMDPQAEAGHYAALSLVARAEALARSIDIDGAVAAYRQAHDLDPNSFKKDGKTEASGIAAAALVVIGKALATEGNTEEAIAKYTQAKELSSASVTFDPKQEAGRLSAQHAITIGREAGQNGNVTDSIAWFTKAKQLDPSLKLDPEPQAYSLAAVAAWNAGKASIGAGKFDAGIASYQTALATYNKFPALDPKGESRAALLNNICWESAASGHAATALQTCENAVEASANLEDLWSVRDSRGLARALTGDINGAMEDFQYYADNAADAARKAERRQWIVQLRAGQNPFTADVLKALAKQ